MQDSNTHFDVLASNVSIARLEKLFSLRIQLRKICLD